MLQDPGSGEAMALVEAHGPWVGRTKVHLSGDRPTALVGVGDDPFIKVRAYPAITKRIADRDSVHVQESLISPSEVSRWVGAGASPPLCCRAPGSRLWRSRGARGSAWSLGWAGEYSPQRRPANAAVRRGR